MVPSQPTPSAPEPSDPTAADPMESPSAGGAAASAAGPRTVVALSGGVDSAVAAALLAREGRNLIGVHLRTGVEADGEAAGGARSCCGADDARDARIIAARLGIPFYVVDVADAFQHVIQDFAEAYASGRTPNPCVLCNKGVKFGRLLQIARELGAGTIATGHYARLLPAADGRTRLLRAVDAQKDQSYVLYALNDEQRAAARFPLGQLEKSAVREQAAALGIHVADKPDSQELCFVPRGDYRAWLAEHHPEALVPGPVVDAGSGAVIGEHGGAAGYTLGQRKGLPAVGERRYVVSVDAPAGVVEVGDRAAVSHTVVQALDVNWIRVEEAEPGTRYRVQARVRNTGRPAPAWLVARGGRGVELTFDAPVFAPARGQALVAYQDDDVLCGGVIVGAHSSATEVAS